MNILCATKIWCLHQNVKAQQEKSSNTSTVWAFYASMRWRNTLYKCAPNKFVTTRYATPQYNNKMRSKVDVFMKFFLYTTNAASVKMNNVLVVRNLMPSSLVFFCTYSTEA